MNDAQKQLIRKLYDQLLLAVTRNEDLRPQSAMQLVVAQLYQRSYTDFVELVKLCEQANIPIKVWDDPEATIRVVYPSRGVSGGRASAQRITHQQLLPTQEFELHLDEFASGNCIFDVIGHPDAGLEEEYRTLAKIFEERLLSLMAQQ